jgi:hypothetical protein
MTIEVGKGARAAAPPAKRRKLGSVASLIIFKFK